MLLVGQQGRYTAYKNTTAAISRGRRPVESPADPDWVQ